MKIQNGECIIGAVSGDASLAVREAVDYCLKQNIKRLTLEKGEYHFYPETAAEDENCCVSNHGHNGYKRTAFLITDADGLTVDCSGSLLVFHGAMNAFIVRRCKNTELKNFRILFEKTLHGQFRVTASGEDYVEITQDGAQGYAYENGLLCLENEQGTRNVVYSCLEKRENGEFAYGEQCFGRDFLYLKNEDRGNGTVRIYNPDRKPAAGNYVILIAAERYSNAVLLLESENVRVSGACVHSCYGIAYHAQLCKNVELIHCKTLPYRGRCFSANADASHFVGCRGTVRLAGCEFNEQLDDGSNIHGAYTKIIAKDSESVIVKYMHYQCRGINIFEDGCTVKALDPLSLIPHKTARVKRAETLNTESTRLYLEGGTDGFEKGELIDSVDFYPEVIIEDCRFVNNRGRGILAASEKRTLIRNNYFRVSGTAVNLESDSVYWYESGRIGELVIENNVFDNCCSAQPHGWGNDVIYASPREKTEDGKYFHGSIIIRNNNFSSCSVPAVNIENAEYIEVKNNKLYGTGENIRIFHCKNENISNNSY